MTSIAERVVLVDVGRSKLADWVSVNLSARQKCISTMGVKRAFNAVQPSDGGMEDCYDHSCDHSPVLYPISIVLHLSPWQNPKTPKSTPSKEAKEICFMIGVESTEIRSKAKAAKSNTVRGVAGRNIFEVQGVFVAV